ncbi:MAG: NAD(P)H-hydrate dehydratase [Pyrinomonadaceae bacterium]|nr:NAD(P)H-hydrate dehydratase [Pyrinomonadaceae bacterium]
MQKVLTAEEMREVDRLTTEKYGIPSIILMENAAHAAAAVIKEKLGGSVAGKSFLILCGKGNNGGDGAALARILWTQGAKVQIYLFGNIDETKGDARINFEFCKKNYEENKRKEKPRFWFFEFYNRNWVMEVNSMIQVKSTTSIKAHTIVVDALFGTGLSKKIEGQFEELVKRIVDVKRKYGMPYYFSLDIPSGLSADFGERIGENIQADLTVTFTAPKLANVLPPASNFNGELVVANIGSPQELIDASPSQTFVAEKQDALDWLGKTEFSAASYKNKRGHALLVVGSREYTGAGVLAGNAAIVSGVGLVTVATSESAQIAISSKISEEVIVRGLPEDENGVIADEAFEGIEKLSEKVDAVGIGCGLGIIGRSPRVSKGGKKDEATDATARLRDFVENRQTPIIIDADGLNALSPFKLKGSDEFPIVLTPHEGEFLRLLGTTDREVLKDRVAVVREFARKHQVILVLKGERTLIASPDGRIVINPTGNPGLGKAGNGDTLAGVITGFAAQAAQFEIDMFETVVAAIYIAGLAGDIAAEKYGKRSMLASDVRECLKEAFERITDN